ncbi:MAG: hypothetical protein RLY57_742 [Candidatus Parcubacteria bacterium]|jgi:hypothetical protein
MNQEPQYELEGQSLAHFGWVHITGLPFTRRAMVGNEPQQLKVSPEVSMLGTHANNNGYQIVVTERGKVWLKYTAPQEGDEWNLVKQLCPNGQDVGMGTSCCIIVDCTEQVPMHMMLARMSDPLWEKK